MSESGTSPCAQTPFEQMVMAQFTSLHRAIAELQHQGKASLTQTEFAQLAGLSRTTIKRRVKSGEIKLKDGRVPYKYLREILS